MGCASLAMYERSTCMRRCSTARTRAAATTPDGISAFLTKSRRTLPIALPTPSGARAPHRRNMNARAPGSVATCDTVHLDALSVDANKVSSRSLRSTNPAREPIVHAASEPQSSDSTEAARMKADAGALKWAGRWRLERRSKADRPGASCRRRRRSRRVPATLRFATPEGVSRGSMQSPSARVLDTQTPECSSRGSGS
jgi:hypothetical protein